VAIAGICGRRDQALAEAALAGKLGCHAGLLSLATLADADDDELMAHCRAVADVIPVVGFYLQPAVGGRVLGHAFWRRFAEIEGVVAIKMAPFNRYYTIDVVRAVAEAGRDDIALYTGNDDNIVIDLLTPYRFAVGGGHVERRIVGGLLGHWSVWTLRAVELLVRHKQVDPERLGCCGHSYGGRMTMLTAAVEPRIRIAAPSGALNVMQERIGNRYSCGAQVIPGLLQYGDVPEIGSLIAPRWCVWIAGKRDGLIKPEWADKALVRIRRAYRALGVEDRLVIDRWDGPHRWHGDVAYPMMEKVLQPPVSSPDR